MQTSEQQIQDDIERYGWHVVLVRGDSQTYGYTIGIHQTFGKPELFITGLALENIHAYCNEYGSDIKAGIEYKPGNTVTKWFQNLLAKMAFIDVHDGWKPFFLGKLVNYVGNITVPVLQAVWSDENGLMPLTEGFDPKLEGKQFFINSKPT